jgi:hypothetical protein
MVVNPCACALKKFGTTKNFRKAAFIMPDGRMIDFSSGSKYRTLQHIDIHTCMNGKKKKTWQEIERQRLAWMDKCKAIRFQDCCEVEGGKVRIEALTKPTKKQIARIVQAVKKVDYFYAISNGGGDCVYKAEHPTKRDVEKWVSRCW